tara:strand:+ start:1069 stop:1314 length:246 start_codon:yes stop_codon:yes gene_type:complete
MSKAEKAFELQEEIGRKIDELKDLGFEFMFYNNISSIRRIRDNYNPSTMSKEEIQLEDDMTAEMDAQAEKNADYALDNMTR